MIVVKLQATSLVCASPVTSVDNNASFGFGGSDANYQGEARVKDCNVWDEEW